jgi:hypothetical protein
MPLDINGQGSISGITSLNTVVSDAELERLDGVTSAIQTQLNDKLPIAGGKILQIVRAIPLSSGVTTTSTSYTDVTGMSITITPQRNTSAVLLIATGQMTAAGSSGAVIYGRLGITDSSNNAISGAQDAFIGNQNFSYTGNGSFLAYYNLFAWSTPSTTSAVTYKLRFRVDAATTTLAVQPFGSTSQMFAIEVSA